MIALIIALGGTGYAAIARPANSVGNTKLDRRAGTVRGAHHAPAPHSAGTTKFFCTLPVTVTGRTTNTAGEAGL